jgi:hypothetical protein
VPWCETTWFCIFQFLCTSAAVPLAVGHYIKESQYSQILSVLSKYQVSRDFYNANESLSLPPFCRTLTLSITYSCNIYFIFTISYVCVCVGGGGVVAVVRSILFVSVSLIAIFMHFQSFLYVLLSCPFYLHWFDDLNNTYWIKGMNQ